MSHTPAPSSGEHCEPCGFTAIEAVLEQERERVLDSLSLRQIQLVEKGIVTQSAASQAAVEEKLEMVQRANPGSITEKRIEAGIVCANRIMNGECSLFMLRRKGVNAGKIVQKLVVHTASD